MKKVIVIFLFLLILFLPSQIFAERKVPILVYHSIDEYKGIGTKDLYVTPKNFEKQMMYLRDQGYTLVTFDRWQDISKVNKPIFITFDDGYKNNLHAFEIFRKLENEQFKPTGTIFVISDFIGRTHRLTKSDLKMLTDSGIFSIQSHTATHPDLTKIKNYEYELKESKDKIQKITGKPVIALAYPYGNSNEKVVAETKKYYSFGLTTTPALYSGVGLKDELFLLPRIYVKYSTSIKEFAELLDG
ncbi:polysaccharide deacetylase family protein [Peribacillus huizhouensis]|uniref:Peptidoglycan/xylan/chitin deacetylase (PgdA/CDA1 family) n=1 Tax=Peribacillus huizhouensis TaxID=1501239 RepID=A0ABR6CTG9_9BACI|nr:polysaccharide deacetylase family protein [Peribacillus huizhouensis]MBA9028300.1 peptidoglycan/xylan/chitin deacetylase (PgdA/CDA1 family) [Peribacillus huizhouensis]